jgi:hypothetical protein
MIFRKFSWKPASDFHVTKVGTPQGSCQQRATPTQELQIHLLVIGFRLLPAAIEDAQPLECQEADCRVVRFVLLVPVLLVIGSGPLRWLDRTACKLGKRLAQKLDFTLGLIGLLSMKRFNPIPDAALQRDRPDNRQAKRTCTHWRFPLASGGIFDPDRKATATGYLFSTGMGPE